MTTINHEVNEMLAAEDAFAAHENIIKALAKAFGADDQSDNALAKAREKHNRDLAGNTRALATVLAGINTDLTATEINLIADKAAELKAKGNPAVKKARKSEMRVFLDQRHQVSAVIKSIDEAIDDRDSDDKPLNLRSAVLASLRATKKDSSLTASQAVRDYLAKHDHVASADEKLEAALMSLASKAIFKDNPKATAAFKTLRAIITGTADTADTADSSGTAQQAGSQGQPETDPTAKFLEEMGLGSDPAPQNIPETNGEAPPSAPEDIPGTQVVQATETKPAPLPSGHAESLEMDIDSLIGGIL